MIGRGLAERAVSNALSAVPAYPALTKE